MYFGVDNYRLNFIKLYTVISILCIALFAFVALRERYSSVYTRGRTYGKYVSILGSGMIVLNTIWKWIDAGIIICSERAALIVNFVYFIFDIMIYYNLTLYYDYSCGQIYSKKKKLLLFIPFGFTLFLEVLNLKYRFLYNIVYDSTIHAYHYERGELFLLGSLFPYGIMIGNVIMRFYSYIKNNMSTREKNEYHVIYIMFLSAAISISALINTQLDPIPVYSIVLALGVYMYYFHEVESQVSLDSLTKLSNKREMYFVMGRQIENIKNISGKKLWLIMIDANDFKAINDGFGHDIGDKALIEIADAMRKIAGMYREYRCFIFRFGGDEFGIIMVAEDEEPVNNLITQINNYLEAYTKNEKIEYKISLSFGYCFYESWMDKSDFIKKADNMLYENKKKYHLLNQKN